MRWKSDGLRRYGWRWKIFTREPGGFLSILAAIRLIWHETGKNWTSHFIMIAINRWSSMSFVSTSWSAAPLLLIRGTRYSGLQKPSMAVLKRLDRNILAAH